MTITYDDVNTWIAQKGSRTSKLAFIVNYIGNLRT